MASKYDEKFCKKNAARMVELFSAGASVPEVCRELGIKSKQTFFTMCKRSELWKTSYEEGRLYCEAFWMAIGRRVCLGKQSCNSRMYELQMRNRFNWLSEKTQNHNINENVTMTPDDYQKIRDRLRKDLKKC